MTERRARPSRTQSKSESTTAGSLTSAAHAVPADLPPGLLHRAAVYLALSDDVPPLVRGTTAWWVRAGVFRVALVVIGALVAIGG